MTLPKGFSIIPEKQLLRYRFTYNKNRYTVYGATTKECYLKRDELIENLKDGLHIENRNITLEHYYELWKIELKKSVKESTIYAYDKSWSYIQKLLGRKKLKEINKGDVITFQNTMAKRKLTNATINRCTRLLKQIMESALNDRIINFNPVTNVKKLKTDNHKAVDTNHRALTKSETKLFLEKASECYYYNMFLFMLNTGVRVGECCALTWSDIDYSNKEICICKTVSRTSDKGFEILDTPKTGSSFRTIPLTDNISKILKAQKTLLYSSMVMPKNNLVFTNKRGEMTNYNNVNICIENIIKQIGIESFTSHAFRDTFATRCIEQGMQPKTLQKILGHSSLNITMDLYVHVMSETKYEELSKIDLVI